MKFEFEGKVIEFYLVRRKRRTLSILVDIDEKIKVTAPFRVSEEEVLKIVKSKGTWIIKKQNEIKNINKNKIIRKFQDGGIFMYLGSDYTLRVDLNKDIKNINIELLESELVIKTNTYNEEKIKLP